MFTRGPTPSQKCPAYVGLGKAATALDNQIQWNLTVTTTSIIKCITYDLFHYGDVIMSAMASKITSLAIGYSTVYSGENERKHQSSASLAFVRGIKCRPVNSPQKEPVTRNMFPFDDVIKSVKCFNQAWMCRFTLAKNFCLLELILVALGHLDELQKAENIPLPGRYRQVSLY